MNSTSALRSSEGITTADALVPDPTASTLQNSDPAGITHGAASLVDFVDDAVPTSLANQTVLGTHAALEGTSDQNGVAGTVHGVTNLGETAGLGHIGDQAPGCSPARSRRLMSREMRHRSDRLSKLFPSAWRATSERTRPSSEQLCLRRPPWSIRRRWRVPRTPRSSISTTRSRARPTRTGPPARRTA